MPKAHRDAPKDKPAYQCSVLLPLRDGAALSRQTLEALVRSLEGVQYEVILVDDGTRDETATLLEALSGDVQILRHEQRTSFAQAYNAAARRARSPWLLLLRHNTAPTPGFLSALLSRAEREPAAAIIGSKLVNASGAVQHAGVVFSRDNRLPYHVYERFPSDAPEVNRARALQAVTCAGMLTRRETFAKLGGFDEAFRDGYEDVDYCLRARAAGHGVWYEPASVLRHTDARPETTLAERLANRDLLLSRYKGVPLADEDVVLAEDGYARVYARTEEHTRAQMRRFCDDAEAQAFALLARAEEAATRGDRDAVRALMRDAERLPDEASALQWAGVLAAWAGDEPTAESLWCRALARDESPELRATLARLALGRGKPDVARVHIEALLSRSAADPEGWFLHGVERLAAGAFHEASTAFESALLNGADTRRALVGQGSALFYAGEHDVAFDVFSAVVAEHPQDGEAMNWLLRAAAATSRWADLADSLTERVARNPGDAAARFALSAAHVRCNDARAARRELERLRRSHPTFLGLEELAGAISALPRSQGASAVAP